MAKHHQEQDAGPDNPAPQPPAAARRPGQIRLGLLATWTASWQARRALEQLHLPADIAHTGALLVSELVTNSVRHARLAPGELIWLSVDWSGTRLGVHVHDGGRRGRRPAASGAIGLIPEAESGWGLYLVDRLASRWGLDPGGYWFELHHNPPS
jgi:anti-sigma regulatory factor (Ser/Thr protein kinase)